MSINSSKKNHIESVSVALHKQINRIQTKKSLKRRKESNELILRNFGKAKDETVSVGEKEKDILVNLKCRQKVSNYHWNDQWHIIHNGYCVTDKEKEKKNKLSSLQENCIHITSFFLFAFASEAAACTWSYRIRSFFFFIRFWLRVNVRTIKFSFTLIANFILTWFVSFHFGRQ